MLREGWKKRISLDFLVWVIAAALCMLWRWVADKSEIVHYWALFGILAVLWVVLGFAVQLYRSYKETWLWQSVMSLVADAGILIGLCWWVLPKAPYQLSPRVAMWTILIVLVFELVIVITEHYWKYATNMLVPAMQIEQRKNAQVQRQDEKRSKSSIEAIHQSVLSVTTEADYYLLRKKARLDSRLTKVVCDRNRFAFLQLQDYQYDTIVDLTLLNDAKGINRRFCIVNQKLPDGGRYVCCYRPQEYIKQKILKRYPWGLNWIVYCFYFWNKRVVPRLMLTSRLYYDLTKGRKRMLSKTEVLGRLYYCGFEVDEIVPMGHIEYVFAHRHSQPYPQEQIKVYGPLIKLPRVCKNKEIRFFYKMRTMHPYAEYIQKYVYDTYGTKDGDKAANDFRITTWGHIFRSLWIDELPMIINLLRGDMKLVGVRPLSKTKFDTYPEWLQELRTQVKPGLIPPFYADMPQTQEEMFESEARYTRAYLEHPILTDWRYFWKAFYQIVFNHARSK